jgi:hypothetical protein
MKKIKGFVMMKNEKMKKIKGLIKVFLFLFFMSGLISYIVIGKIHWPITIVSTIGFSIILYIIIKIYN